MKRRDYDDYIQDIYNAILDIEEFTSGIEFENFRHDKRTVLAVTRSL